MLAYCCFMEMKGCGCIACHWLGLCCWHCELEGIPLCVSVVHQLQICPDKIC